MQAIDLYELEKAYVCGQVAGRRPDGSLRIVFPTIRQLVDQFDVSKCLVAGLSKRNGWVKERRRYQQKLRSASWNVVARARAAGDEC
jgi:hypothetical protein